MFYVDKIQKTEAVQVAEALAHRKLHKLPWHHKCYQEQFYIVVLP